MASPQKKVDWAPTPIWTYDRDWKRKKAENVGEDALRRSLGGACHQGLMLSVCRGGALYDERLIYNDNQTETSKHWPMPMNKPSYSLTDTFIVIRSIQTTTSRIWKYLTMLMMKLIVVTFNKSFGRRCFMWRRSTSQKPTYGGSEDTGVYKAQRILSIRILFE